MPPVVTSLLAGPMDWNTTCWRWNSFPSAVRVVSALAIFEAVTSARTRSAVSADPLTPSSPKRFICVVLPCSLAVGVDRVHHSGVFALRQFHAGAELELSLCHRQSLAIHRHVVAIRPRKQTIDLLDLRSRRFSCCI